MSLRNQLTHLLVSATLTALIANASAHAFEREGHGGEPEEISAPVFPDQKTLRGAIDLIEGRLASTAVVSAELSASVRQELHALFTAEKFRVLPAIIIKKVREPSCNTPGESSSSPQTDEAERFISLGGYTDPEKGATVYLSARLRTYSADRLAPVVLHESLHHVLSLGLSKDECFVEELTQVILGASPSRALTFALEKGVYLKPNTLSKRQLIDFLDPEQLFTFRWWPGEQKDYTKKLLLLLPENVADLSVSEFLHLAVALDPKKNPDLDSSIDKREKKLLVHLLRRAGEANPANPLIASLSQVRPPPYGCKKPIVDLMHTAYSCRAEDEILMKDLFALP